MASMQYTKKTPAELAYNDNVRHVRARVDEALKTVREAILNEELDRMSKEFRSELDEGRILRYGLDASAVTAALEARVHELAALEMGEPE